MRHGARHALPGSGRRSRRCSTRRRTSSWTALACGARRAATTVGRTAPSAEHFATRRSAFPLNASEVARRPPPRSAQAFPSAPDVAAARADSVIGGRYDLLGYRGLHARHAAGLARGRRPSAPLAADLLGVGAVSRSRRRRSQSHLGAQPASALAVPRRGLTRSPASRASTTRSASARATGSRPTRRSSAPTGRACWSSRSAVCRGSGRSSCSRARRVASGSRAVDRRSARRARPAADAHRAQPVALLQPEHAPVRRSAGAVCRGLCAARAEASARRAAIGRDDPDPGSDTADPRRRRPRRAVGALSPLFDRLLPARGARRPARRRSGRLDLRGGGAPAGALPAHDLRRRAANGRSSATTTADSCFRSAAGHREIAGTRSPTRPSS